MFVKLVGSAVYGVDAVMITIEVNWTSQGKEYCIVGLADSAIKESLHRIESSIKCMKFEMPRTRIVINLAPADLRKSGTAFDLPMAIGILAASEQINLHPLFDQFIMMGELSLDGELRPIRGALAIALEARKKGFKGFLLPEQNAKEAALVTGINVFGKKNISDVIEFIKNEGKSYTPVTVDIEKEFNASYQQFENDFSDVKGQENIKRALEIAAAGGHNVILIGPPGAGKTMLAKRLPTILPPLSIEEALETTKIHSVAGKHAEHTALITKRPYRSPHHSISDVALVGGGTSPQPGEISLAHHGVLFLDELPEFKRSVLEVMRQPMEERKVSIARAKMSIDYPTSFMLIASMNPCPCGFYNHPEKNCTCSPGVVQKYLNKVSGPLLDRIDLHVEVTPVSFSELASIQTGDSSNEIRKRVIAARKIQDKRFEKEMEFSPMRKWGPKNLKKFANSKRTGCS